MSAFVTEVATTVSEVYSKAADLIDSNGMKSGGGVGPGGCMCMLSAMCAAVGIDPESWPNYPDTALDDYGNPLVTTPEAKLYADAAQHAEDELGMPAWRWNDTHVWHEVVGDDSLGHLLNKKKHASSLVAVKLRELSTKADEEGW